MIASCRSVDRERSDHAAVALVRSFNGFTDGVVVRLFGRSVDRS